jgi:hypothetical protein
MYLSGKHHFTTKDLYQRGKRVRLAWLDPELESCCVCSSRLRALTGDQADAAEDLLYLVARAPRLAAITTFQSVRVGVTAGNLTFSIEEIDMHTRPLNSDGIPQQVQDQKSLPDYALWKALVIDDLRVRGKSVSRLAS